MTEIDLITAVSQVGFPITVAVYLLWKGYTQDQEFLKVLTELKNEILEIRKEHDRILKVGL
jgi:hypothetical protein